MTTPVDPTLIEALKRDVAIEVGIVHQQSGRGFDYTVNCTNTIVSLAEHYAQALITKQVIAELNKLYSVHMSHFEDDICDQIKARIAELNTILEGSK